MSQAEEHIFLTNFEPIPKVFWSDLTGKPFEQCIMCERHLLEDGTQYLVEKAIKTYKGRYVKDTVFEYAICMDCRDTMHEKLSEESRVALSGYFNSRFNPAERVAKYEHGTVEERLKHCLLEGEEPSEGGEYQIYALCDGSDMINDLMPFMIRGESLEAVMHLISAKSLDELNGFMKENFTGPPEFKEILDGGPRVFI